MKLIDKRYLAIIVVLILSGFIAGCSDSKSTSSSFRLQGEIENPADIKHVMLYDGELLVDSAALDSDNKFIIEREITEPTLFTLLAGFRPYGLILQAGDDVTFKTDLENGEEYEVSGSDESQRMKELNMLRANLQKEQNDIQEEFESRTEKGEDTAVVQAELMEQSRLSIERSAKKIYEFSDANRDKLAGLYGMLLLYSVDAANYEADIIEYAEEAKKRFPTNETLDYFAQHLVGVKALSIGQLAPDFASTTPDGETVKLSDFRGQYVLLDFWAAWCGPCREENPNIVEQYHAFKDKGFTVLGVSLDKTKEAWLKAIKDDKLDWTHVSDLKQWDSEAGRLYNITAIPASFLIDPDGKLIAKNLRGPELKRFLEKTFN